MGKSMPSFPRHDPKSYETIRILREDHSFPGEKIADKLKFVPHPSGICSLPSEASARLMEGDKHCG